MKNLGKKKKIVIPRSGTIVTLGTFDLQTRVELVPVPVVVVKPLVIVAAYAKSSSHRFQIGRKLIEEEIRPSSMKLYEDILFRYVK